jgi:dTDP-4-amino-4,6-dideoxygalactose transaminase
MSGKELQYVNEAFATNWIAPLGPNVTEFENSLEKYHQNNTHIAAISSGTAALHLALIILGVTRNDEVICQSKTFAASANPIMYQGATPIFVDSEKDTWNICPKLLEDTIKDRITKGKKPKAIIAVHLYGMPYKVKEINDVGKKYEIPIIEDSAESLGSTYNNQKCGTFGDLAILSFNGNKIITTSGGGALITKSKEDKEKAIFLATQARDKGVAYLHSHVGYNYRMSNVIAGIGRGQMEVIDKRVLQRRQNFEFYKSELKSVNEIVFLEEPQGCFSNRWLTTILTQSFKMREELRKLFEKENIEIRPLWKPMHQQPIFLKYPKYINGVSDELFEKGLCLPSGSNLSHNDLNRILKCFKSYFAYA